MKKLIIGAMLILGILFVPGCEQSHKKAVDGYYFEKETFLRTQIQVKIVLIKNQTEMDKLSAQHGMKTVPNEVIKAFATLSKNEPACTIYVIDPKIEYNPEWIGHELVHCIYGDWHKVQP